MNSILQKWFGDEIEVSETSQSAIVMYLNRDTWISARTLQHILLLHNWEVKIVLNSSGRSFCNFSELQFMHEKSTADIKTAESSNSMCTFLQSLFGTTTHAVTGSRTPVGSTSVSIVEARQTPLRLDTDLIATLLNHPRVFDVHLKYNKLVVMETLPASSPLSLAVLRKQGKFNITQHNVRKTQRARIRKKLKKIARGRVPVLRSN